MRNKKEEETNMPKQVIINKNTFTSNIQMQIDQTNDRQQFSDLLYVFAVLLVHVRYAFENHLNLDKGIDKCFAEYFDIIRFSMPLTATTMQRDFMELCFSEVFKQDIFGKLRKNSEA